MQKAKDLQEIIFSECKDIIISISQISNVEELLQKQNLFSQISEKISVLKFLETQMESWDSQDETSQDFQAESQDFQTELAVENQKSEEEITLENIENEIEETTIETEDTSEEITFDLGEEEEVYEENVAIEEEISADISLDLVEDEEEILPKIEIPQVEEIYEENDISINKDEIQNTEYQEENLAETSEEPKEKKLKLAKIKVQNPHIDTLFDEQTMNEITEKPQPKEPIRREFVLDLNDRIAFSKMLFDGSQVELSNVVKRLNAFSNVDDAKQYLSDMYYDKGWEKVDEYAQRLWILVENKFL